MLYFYILFLLIFIVIGILKNKKGEFLKQIGVTLMVISNIAAIFSMGAGDELYVYISMNGMIAGLLLYLYSTAKR